MPAPLGVSQSDLSQFAAGIKKAGFTGFIDG
jgi:hypothetical protein